MGSLIDELRRREAAARAGPGRTGCTPGSRSCRTSRGWLAGVPGGLFTLPDHAGKAAKPGR